MVTAGRKTTGTHAKSKPSRSEKKGRVDAPGADSDVILRRKGAAKNLPRPDVSSQTGALSGESPPRDIAQPGPCSHARIP